MFLDILADDLVDLKKRIESEEKIISSLRSELRNRNQSSEDIDATLKRIESESQNSGLELGTSFRYCDLLVDMFRISYLQV